MFNKHRNKVFAFNEEGVSVGRALVVNYNILFYTAFANKVFNICILGEPFKNDSVALTFFKSGNQSIALILSSFCVHCEFVHTFFKGEKLFFFSFVSGKLCREVTLSCLVCINVLVFRNRGVNFFVRLCVLIEVVGTEREVLGFSDSISFSGCF